MFDPVQPAQARPGAVSLRSSAVTPPAGGRWENGFTWVPEQCPIPTQTFTPCADLTGDLPDSAIGEQAFYQPPAFRVRRECRARSGEPDLEALRRQVDAVTSHEVARELWSGARTRAEPAYRDGGQLFNPYLASPEATVVAASGGGWLSGLSELEEAAKVALKGQQVYLHVPIRALADLQFYVRRVGQVLMTPLDSVVVADSGYDGSGPFSAGTAEVQTVTITGAPTGGTFTLAHAGNTTTAIPRNATAAQVQAALLALPHLDDGDVVVTGSAGGPWTVTFTGVLGNVPTMGATSSLTGGTNPAVAVATTTAGVDPVQQAGEWIYATGPVSLRLSPIEVTDDRVGTFKRDTNTFEVWGDRLFAATFDPCSLHALNTSASN